MIYCDETQLLLFVVFYWCGSIEIMTTADLTTITKASRGVQSLHVRYATGLDSADRLSHPSNSFDIKFESSNCLIPIPWPINEKLCIPYDNADIPFLKKLLFSSDCGLISKSLQALVERAYDGFKAMYMLRLVRVVLWYINI